MTAQTFRPIAGARPGFLRAAAAVLAALLLAGTLAACEDATSTEDFLSRAEDYRDKGNLKASTIEAKNALQQDPRNADARWLLGLNYLDLGKPLAAETELRRARDNGLNPNLILRPLARVWLMQGKFDDVLKIARITDDMRDDFKAKVLVLRGYAEAGTGKNTEATKTLQEALRHDPRSFGAFLGFAQLAAARLASEEAEVNLRKAIEIAPNDWDVLTLQGTFAFRKRDYAESERAYQKLVNSRPERPSFQLLLARAQIASGKFDLATKRLDDLLKLFPNHPPTNYLRALVAFQSKDYATSAAHAEAVLKVNRDDLPSILIAGAANFGLRQYERALNNLQRFVSDVPSHAVARRLLGATQMRLRKPKEAVTTLKPIAVNENADASLLDLIGMAAVQAGDLNAGSGFFERVVALEPKNAPAHVKLGETKIALGEVDKGIRYLERAVETDPNLPRADVALIVNLLRARQFEKALAAAQRLQEKRPKLAAGYTFAGLAYLGMNKEKLAVAMLKKAIEVTPGDFEALRNLAILAKRRRDFDAAREHLKTVLKYQDGHLRALLMLADIETGLRRSHEAIRWLEEAIDKNPNILLPRLHLGRWYLSTGSPEKALAAIQPALQQYRTDPSLLEVRGKAQLATKRYANAAVTFRALVDKRPKSAEAHFLLAEAYAGTREVKSIRSELETALKLDAKHQGARLALARVLLRLGKLAETEKHLEKLKQAAPGNPEYDVIEGDLLVARRQPGDAVHAYQRALSKGQSAELMMKIARAQWLAGHQADGLDTLKRWVAANPGSNSARLQLGGYYASLGRLDDAKSQFSELAKRTPDDWVPYNELAWVLLRMGNTGEAMPHAKRALDLSRTNPIVIDTLGSIYLTQGEIKRALELLQKAYRLAPRSRDIALNLARAFNENRQRDRARLLLTRILKDKKYFRERKEAEALLKSLED